MSDTKIAIYLRNNPKMTGVLFTAMLLLTQTGNVAAAAACSHGGP